MTAIEAPVRSTANGRQANGRFAVGNAGGPGGTYPDRINLVKLARRKAKEFGLDLEGLVWDALFAMLVKASCGDTKAAALILDRFAGAVDRGPLINLELGAGAIPQAPPVTADGTGAPTLAEHLERLVTIARERGTQLGALADLKPAEVVVKIAEDKAAAAAEELLS
jgi:hypothetical protein